MRAAFALSSLALLCACQTEPAQHIQAGASQASGISGAAYVVDGDTLDIGSIRFRLNGIDAPELGTRAGAIARSALMQATSGQVVTCQPNGDVTYGRLVARCYAGGQDVAAMVIASGAALDCARYSGGRYRHLETAAARGSIARSSYC